jgi:hypothetical protein
MAEQSNQDRINQFKAEEALQRNLSSLLQDRITKTGQLTKLQKELVDSTAAAKGLDEKLLAIEEEKEKVLEKVAKFNRQIDKDMLKMLDTAEEYLKIEKKRKETTEKLKDLQEELKDSMQDALGISKEYVDAFKVGGVMALGFMAATKAVEGMKEAFDNTVGVGMDFVRNMGASVGEAAHVTAEVTKAQFSMTGLLYGSEAVAESAKSVAEYYGSAKAVTADMLKDVTELSALGAEGPAQLAGIFEKASGDAGAMTSEIKEIAEGVGVDAGSVIQEMSKNQSLLVGKSKEEIAVLAKKTAELKKQGQSMELLQSVSDNMLNIEGSLRSEMKARLMTGKDINAQAVREAAMIAQTTGDYSTSRFS